MKAYEAADLSYRNNKMKKGISEINKKIKKTATTGKFTLTCLICYDWGSNHDLKQHYEKEGYKVSLSHKQTSPNDGDDYITITWE